MHHSRGRRGGHVLLLALSALLLVPGIAAAAGVDDARVVEVTVGDRAELERLVATGADIGHEVDRAGGEVTVNVVTSAAGARALEAQGFQVGETLYSDAQSRRRVAERERTIARKEAAEESLAAQGEGQATDVVKIIRADYFTTTRDRRFINVEAKSSSLDDATLTVRWDSGPGTPMGSGGTETLRDFVEFDVYLYHYRQIPVTGRPSRIEVTSSDGGSDIAEITDWIPGGKDDPSSDPYFKDFIDHYMQPDELYERIESLAAEFPQLAEIVELPHRTAGYEYNAQRIFGRFTSTAVVVTQDSYGIPAGGPISVDLRDPGAPSSPLDVTVAGNAIIVSLATDAEGEPTSTAAEVVAAINAAAGGMVTADTYRGNDGDGVVEPDSAYLDNQTRHDPFQPIALRIGKHRDGSRTGVFFYAQEHAREWVPPLVTIETAERLLRNYAHDGATRRLLDSLDVFILPSVNPDGSHYSFNGFNFQRKNMVNHCPPGESDPSYRDQWGVDVNRNYEVGSAYDGYFGASTLQPQFPYSGCRSGTFAGPAEHSEAESRNVVWVADTFDHIKFAMNVHSSGNYFMWSPGAYKAEGRETLPRPTFGEESFFWAASEVILTAIEEHRGLTVEPAQTGPVVDVLYSAAGNSGDELWYDNRIYAWDFEVGDQGFQPPWDEAHEQAMEFANGLVGMLDVAYAWTKDHRPPKVELVGGEHRSSGPVELRFETSEPATVFYTLDGSRPGPDSTQYGSAGVRETTGETIVLEESATVRWYGTDAAGNSSNLEKATIRIG